MDKTYQKGLYNGIIAFSIWGLLPLYWKLLKAIPAIQIFSHRIFWSFVFLFLIIQYQQKREAFKQLLRDKKRMLYVVLCAFFISCNWYIYIWGVNAGFVIECSLGYYINPLAVVLLGTLVLKEKLSNYQKIAFGFATIGVLNLTFNYGRFPWIALALAFSFAMYGLFKKLADSDAIVGLAMETTLLAPVAFIYISYNETTGVGVIHNVPTLTILILLTVGIATAIPLLLYSNAVNYLPLSVVGFLQYIAPTIGLFLGIFIFKETFTMTHLISFSFIWVGLVIYSYAQYTRLKKAETSV